MMRTEYSVLKEEIEDNELSHRFLSRISLLHSIARVKITRTSPCACLCCSMLRILQIIIYVF
jgi:hypothetical protein